MEVSLNFFLSLGFVLWFIILYLCMEFQDKLCRCLTENAESLGKFELSIMHANDEEGEVPSFYFPSAHLPIMVKNEVHIRNRRYSI